MKGKEEHITEMSLNGQNRLAGLKQLLRGHLKCIYQLIQQQSFNVYKYNSWPWGMHPHVTLIKSVGYEFFDITMYRLKR